MFLDGHPEHENLFHCDLCMLSGNIDFEKCLDKMAKTTSGNHIDPNSAIMGSKGRNLVSLLIINMYMMCVLQYAHLVHNETKLSLLLCMASEFGFTPHVCYLHYCLSRFVCSSVLSTIFAWMVWVCCTYGHVQCSIV